MPTIDQLPAASASTDEDMLIVSQAGIVRSVTRLELLANTHPLITVAPGTLLGGVLPSPGPPQQVSLGAGLVFQNGSLAVVPPAAPSLVALDASGSFVTPAGASTPRRLADLLADEVEPESFGAIGDGITDDTQALAAAVATLRPVRLGPRVYATSGQWTIASTAVLLGAPSQSVIRRLAQRSGGAWISIQGPAFYAENVVFDANNSVVSESSWALLVTAACLRSEFLRCVFSNGNGSSLGNGLTLLASDPTVTAHVIDSCQAFGNQAHGIWSQALSGVRITNNKAFSNAGHGICVDYNSAPGGAIVRLAQISGNQCWANARGISVGNFNETSTTPPVWGTANPHAIQTLVTNNVCHDNIYYGIAVSGQSIMVQSNLLSANGTTQNGGGGILANCSWSRVCGNTVTGQGQFGIDCGGSVTTDISANHVTGAAVGINPGGSQQVRVAANYLNDNQWAITVYNVETDGEGLNFGLAASGLDIVDNTIVIPNGTGGGIWLIDGPQAVIVARNSFSGTANASIAQCLFAHTDSVIVEGNRWNNTQRLFANPVALNGLQTAVIPDIADAVMLSVVPSGVQSIQTQHQVEVGGQITFIKVMSAGSGYTLATVTIAGPGSGAAAIAYIRNGEVIGISLTSSGNGYDRKGSATSVIISGDGVGATATAFVGLGVLEGRKLDVYCNTATRFSRIGSSPFQENWTLTDITVPANAKISFTGTFGSWRADNVPLADYIAPPGDGSLIVQAMPNSNLTLRTAAAGTIRVTSDVNPNGYVASLGHGSPEGVVVAPAGSDYRNLDGGVGSTLWVKRTGSDQAGWYPVA